MPSNTPQPTIRHATRDDVPTILHLIQALASYERLSSLVEATEDSLSRTLTFAPFERPSQSQGQTQTPAGYARTLLVFTPDPSPEPAGMALYFYSYSTWRGAPGIYIEDLFVKEEFRGRGYGTKLLVEVARETLEIGGKRLEWSVLDWNEPSIGFYQSLGAKPQKEWIKMRLDDDALVELAKKGQGVSTTQ
ncbi:MAG: hypothetical protein M1816_000673 [Peltula sp. TS41687]|nr:MAG: hypothetical protein M1816_000673 [Peltula sp. TS41687]